MTSINLSFAFFPLRLTLGAPRAFNSPLTSSMDPGSRRREETVLLMLSPLPPASSRRRLPLFQVFFKGLFALTLTLGSHVFAQSVQDVVVRVSAVAQASPAQITLSWPADPNASSYRVDRKTLTSANWLSRATLDGGATNYVDTNARVGSAYEYRISITAASYSGVGYIYSGIELPLVESRGRIILVVDQSHTNALAMELARLQRDLVGDGWTVIRHDVSPNDSVVTIRNLIRSDYNAAPGQVEAVFLFGHIPVPYSGDFNADGHSNHKGAWPTDAYYGEMNGVWTDTTVTNATASDPRNRNVPGDGKFDQTQFSSNIELQVGRVDVHDLPAFSLPESELLRRYLNKNHQFRHLGFAAERRGLVDDHFGYFGGEAFAINGWRNFAPLFGPTGTTAADWTTTLADQGYLWGFGAGSGTYTGIGGVTSTDLLAAGDPRVVFTMFFGSFFGDWDSRNNVMRASLATPGFTLTSAWAGRPHWVVHHMGMGLPIGFSAKVTQNNSSTYDFNLGARLNHLALMGDPTLRLHPVPPPSGFGMSTNGNGGMTLTWNPSSEAVVGYAIYRATAESGPFTRQNNILVTSTNYTVNTKNPDIYMVRAVKLEVSPSGSYFNASQGVFQDLIGTFGPPRLDVEREEASVRLTWPLPMMGYHLEASSSMEPDSWTNLYCSVQVSNDLSIVTKNATNDSLFFRLREP